MTIPNHNRQVAQSALGQYLELLTTVQIYRSEHGTYFSDRDAFYYAGAVVAVIPILHAVTLAAAIEIVASVFHPPHLAVWVARLVCTIPFFAAAFFLTANRTYVQGLRTKIRAEQPTEAAQRRRAAKAFARGSYLLGIVSFAYLLLSQVMSRVT